ncbi:hypothetical protein, partial [Peptostreptococcus sp.]
VIRNKPLSTQLAVDKVDPGTLLDTIREYYENRVIATDGFDCDVITEDGVYIAVRFVMEGLNKLWCCIYISNDEKYISIKKLEAN